MEIAIGACDFVFSRLSRRTLLGGLRRGNLGGRLWREFERRRSRRLYGGWMQIRGVVRLRGYRRRSVVVGGVSRDGGTWREHDDQQQPADEDARTSHERSPRTDFGARSR